MMGMIKHFSCSSRDSNCFPTRNNPNPRNFVIQRTHTCGQFVVVEIWYPDCINYEGHKILVFRGLSKQYIKRMPLIDPHFSATDIANSPVARFVPTEDGWNMALKFVSRSCSNENYNK